MPTDKMPFDVKYFVKGDNTDSGWEPIGTLLSEEVLGYLREDVRATDEAYMRIRYAIKKVIFSGPATIVIWMDGTKTIVKCMEGDIYDPEKAIMMCLLEKMLGSKSEVKRFFKKWVPEIDLSELGESIGTIASELGESIGKMVKSVAKALENSVIETEENKKGPDQLELLEQKKEKDE